MTHKELYIELINSVEKYRIENHTTFEKGIAESVGILQGLQAVKSADMHPHGLLTKSEWLESLPRNRPWWRRFRFSW